MTKYEWESELKKNIHRLPDDEIVRVLEYYNELFEDRIESGWRESDIIFEFGNPADVAYKIISEFEGELRPDSSAVYPPYSAQNGYPGGTVRNPQSGNYANQNMQNPHRATPVTASAPIGNAHTERHVFGGNNHKKPPYVYQFPQRKPVDNSSNYPPAHTRNDYSDNAASIPPYRSGLRGEQPPAYTGAPSYTANIPPYRGKNSGEQPPAYTGAPSCTANTPPYRSGHNSEQPPVYAGAPSYTANTPPYRGRNSGEQPPAYTGAPSYTANTPPYRGEYNGEQQPAYTRAPSYAPSNASIPSSESSSAKKSGGVKGGRLFFLVLFCILFGGAFLAITIAYWSIIITLTVTGIVLAIGGFAAIIPSCISLFDSVPLGLVMSGASLVLAALGIIIAVLSVKICAGSAKLTKKIFSALKRWLTKKKV